MVKTFKDPNNPPDLKDNLFEKYATHYQSKL